MRKHLSLFLVLLIGCFCTAFASSIRITKIEPTPLFPRPNNGEELKQLVRISLLNQSYLTKCDLLVTLPDGRTFEEVIDSVYKGQKSYEILIPDIKRSGKVKFSLLKDNQIIAEKVVNWIPQKKWKVYYAAVSHQDLGFETYYQNIRRGVREGGLDMALQYCRETDDWEEDAKFRWNVETSEPILRWLNKRSKAEVEELVRRIKEGRIELGAVHNAISSQMAGYEVLARSFYTPNRYVTDMLDIEPAKVAVINDVTGITRSWPLFSKEADIPYLMHGSNAPNCLQDMYDYPVFYWLSPDGDNKKKTLCRADSYYSENKLSRWDEKSMEKLIARNNRPDWAFDCILAYDSHDFALPTMDNAVNIRAWNKKYAYPRVICSLISSFFDDVASQSNKANIIETDKDAPDSWDDQDATDAELLSLARRTTAEVSTSEKLATITTALSGSRYPKEEVFQAYNGLIMYHEHTNCTFNGGNHHYYEVEKETHRQLVDEAKQFTDSVMGLAVPRLNSLIKTDDRSIVVYNPLNWKRNDIVCIESASLPLQSEGIELYDNVSGEKVPVQQLQNGSLVFFAKDVPSMGYKIYRIAEKPKVISNKATLSSANIIDNDFYTIKLDKKQNIISGIFDKELNTQILDSDSPYALGEYIYYDHLRKEYLKSEFTKLEYFKGDVADEIHIQQSAYLADSLTLIVYVYHDTKKIDFSLTLNKRSNDEQLVNSWVRNMKEAMFCAIPVKVDNYIHHHELAGAVMQPGNLNMQFNSAESAYYAIQHFADASNNDMGVTLSTIDAALVEYGHPRPGFWDNYGRKPKDPVVKPENSNMFLYLMNNFFQTNIMVDQPGAKRFDFSLRSHAGNWKTGKAYQFAWETSNPLLPSYTDKNKKGILPASYSFLSVDKENVICSALKPAESNGSGYIARFFELTGEATKVKVKFNFLDEINRAYKTSLMEEDKQPLSVSQKNEVSFEILGHGIGTIRVVNDKSEKGRVSHVRSKALSDKRILLKWKTDETDKLSYYAIYRSESPDCLVCPYNYVGSTESTSYEDCPHLNYAGWPSNDLQPDKTYYYRICPIDRYNNLGEPSEIVACKTLTSKEKNEEPNKVQGVYAIHVSPLAPENYVTLFFYTNIEKDVQLYEIYRSNSEGFVPGPANLIGTVKPSEKTLNYKGKYSYSELERQMYDDKTAKVGTRYFYKICAVDNAGQRGAFSDEVSIMMSSVPVTIDVKPISYRNFKDAKGAVKVFVKSELPNCIIRYTLDHTTPTVHSQRYDSKLVFCEDQFMTVGLFNTNGELLHTKSIYIKTPKAISNSVYAQGWDAEMVFDGIEDAGSQWVCKAYGGGTKESPADVWMGVFLPFKLDISGVVVVGDDREMMPDFKNFKIYGRSNGELTLLGDLKSCGKMLERRNSWELSFVNPKSVDGIMLYVGADELPCSSDVEQDGLVRVLELKLILSDGTVKSYKEIMNSL